MYALNILIFKKLKFKNIFNIRNILEKYTDTSNIDI